LLSMSPTIWKSKEDTETNSNSARRLGFRTLLTKVLPPNSQRMAPQASPAGPWCVRVPSRKGVKGFVTRAHTHIRDLPADLGDDQILERSPALNLERAAEEGKAQQIPKRKPAQSHKAAHELL
jgi:hypothetical protein